MLNFIVLAHEEGIKTGPESWLGPALFFAIILASVAIGKILVKGRKVVEKEK